MVGLGECGEFFGFAIEMVRSSRKDTVTPPLQLNPAMSAVCQVCPIPSVIDTECDHEVITGQLKEALFVGVLGASMTPE